MAYENYMAALKIFIHMIKCKSHFCLFHNQPLFTIDEKNESLKGMYKEKFMQYENRAKQIKKQALDVQAPAQEDNNQPGGNGGGGGAAAAKPKDKKK